MDEGSSQQRRTSTIIACTQCRRRKVKCDGTAVADGGCRGCRMAGVTCVYATTIRKPGPKAGYIQELETRLEAMEQTLRNLVSTSVISETDLNAVLHQSNSLKRKRTSIPLDSLSTMASAVLSSVHSPVEVRAATQLPPRDIILGLLCQLFARPHGQIFPNIHPPSIIRRIERYGAESLSPVLMYSLLAIAIDSSRDNISTNSHTVISNPVETADLFAREAQKYMDFSNPTIEMVQAQLNLTGFYGRRGLTRAIYVASGIALRISLDLGLNRIDASEEMRMLSPMLPSNEVQKAVERFARMYEVHVEQARECIRRIWWTVFISDRFASSTSGRPPSTDERDCLVRLPGNNYAWWTESVHSNGELAPMFDPDDLTRDKSRSKAPHPELSVYAQIVQLSTIIGKIGRYKGSQRAGSFDRDDEQFDELTQALDAFAHALPDQFVRPETDDSSYDDAVVPVSLRPGVYATISSPWSGLDPSALTSPLDEIFVRIFYNCACLMLHDAALLGPNPFAFLSHSLTELTPKQIRSIDITREAARNITDLLWMQHLTSRSLSQYPSTPKLPSWFKDKISVGEIPFSSYCLFRAGTVHLAVARGIEGYVSHEDRARALLMARQCREILAGLTSKTGVDYKMGREHADQLEDLMRKVDLDHRASAAAAYTPAESSVDTDTTVPQAEFEAGGNYNDGRAVVGDDVMSSDFYDDGTDYTQAQWRVLDAEDFNADNLLKQPPPYDTTSFSQNATTGEPDILSMYDAQNRQVMLDALEEFDFDATLREVFASFTHAQTKKP